MCSLQALQSHLLRFLGEMEPVPFTQFDQPLQISLCFRLQRSALCFLLQNKTRERREAQDRVLQKVSFWVELWVL